MIELTQRRAQGIWSGVDSESLWRDREGFLVIKPLDAAVRVYGYNLVRVIQSVTYSTGIRWLSKPESSNFTEAKPGEAHLEQTESAGRIPVGTIVGLTCGKAAANDSLSTTLAVAADPGKGYQLQSCRDLSAGIWTAEGVIVYSTDTSVQFSIPVDCDAVYYRVMAVNP